jgi:hypothetical protein
MPLDVTTAVRSRQTINPKNVLGFYATVIGLVLGATVGAALVLAETHTSTNLIPWILGIGLAISVLVAVGVFIINLTDPSKLMLGQITGTEYVAIQRAVLGDSLTGEREEFIESRLAGSGNGTAGSTPEEPGPDEEPA